MVFGGLERRREFVGVSVCRSFFIFASRMSMRVIDDGGRVEHLCFERGLWLEREHVSFCAEIINGEVW